MRSIAGTPSKAKAAERALRDWALHSIEIVG
jgi:hypothetical protein